MILTSPLARAGMYFFPKAEPVREQVHQRARPQWLAGWQSAVPGLFTDPTGWGDTRGTGEARRRDDGRRDRRGARCAQRSSHGGM